MSNNACPECGYRAEQDARNVVILGSTNNSTVQNYEELVQVLNMLGSSRIYELLKSEIVSLWNRFPRHSKERRYLTSLVLRMENCYFKKSTSVRARLKKMRLK